jgi:hypothetical protein
MQKSAQSRSAAAPGMIRERTNTKTTGERLKTAF